MSTGQVLRPLRRKLATTLVALGLLGLLVIAVTSYTVAQWRATERTLSEHYTRSLRLQEVRALTFESFKEVSDAVLGSDEDFREEYAAFREPLDATFDRWVALAEDDAERAEVAAVLAAGQRLDDGAAQVFDLVDAGQREQAAEQLEVIEETAFVPFDEVTTAAVQGDRETRRVIRADAADARRTATLVLALAAIGVLSMLLLVAAHLSGGVFTPVRRLRDALRSLNAGAAGVRVPEDGDDEIAEVNREFNALAASLERRAAGTAGPLRAADGAGAAQQGGDDARLVLARLVGALRRDAEAVPAAADDARRAATAAALVAGIDALDAALDRPGGLATAVDLRLAPVEPAVLLHAVVGRYADEVVRRSVSCDIGVDPRTGPVVVDRARLGEALGELVRNGLDALPSRGGRLGVRARREPDGWTALEVQDDGSGISEEDVSWLYDGGGRRGPGHGRRGVGLLLATSVVEQHRGRLQLETPATGGTVARVLLPPGAGRPPAGSPP